MTSAHIERRLGAKDGIDRGPDADGDGFGGAGPVDDRPAAAGRQCPVRGAHLGVERRGFALDAVAYRADALVGDRVGEVDDEHEIRREFTGCELAHPLDGAHTETPADTLVREGRWR